MTMIGNPQFYDDLGHPLPSRARPERVVCLVPSLTESLAVSVPDLLVGATDWCTHPAGLDVVRVRGTKNPDLSAVMDLKPDLVLANKEENRRKDVDALRAAGVPVWVTVIETVDQALESLRRVFADALRQPVPAWLHECARLWAEPAPSCGPTVVIPIWRDPWMVVGSRTFTGDLVARLGLRNLYAEHAERYPRVALAELHRAAPELVLLPDEPYRFTADDGPESFPEAPVALVEGRSLTWYGPSLAGARRLLLRQIGEAHRYA